MTRALSLVVAVGGASAAAATDTFLTGMPRVIVPAICAGLAGGLLQAAIPLGTSSWSARMALKMLGVGALVGAIAGLILSHRWFAGFEDYPKMGVEALCGFLALQILDWVNQLGPKGIAGWLIRRQAAAAVTKKIPP